jgi:hypothetical protein
MKTLGLVIVLSTGVLAMLLTVIPLGTDTTVIVNPERSETALGLLRVAELRIRNDGIFTRSVELPELVACIGDREIALDAYTEANSATVRGAGQLRAVAVQPGETGVVFLVARETSFGETILVYYRTEHFSCLTANNPLN